MFSVRTVFQIHRLKCADYDNYRLQGSNLRIQMKIQ